MTHECIQIERVTKLETNVETICNTIKEHDDTTQQFINKYWENDKPKIDAAHRFIKTFLKVFWLVMAPLIAGLGAGIIYAGIHFGKFLGQ